MKNERGYIAIFALIMMLLLSSLGATLLLLSKTNIQISTSHRDGIIAQYLAEAGIQDAIVKLKTNPELVKQTKTGNYTITVQPTILVPGKGKYKVQIGPNTQTTDTNIRLLTAIGTMNQATRQVVANVTLLKPTGVTVTWNYY